ncbi:hypothetical protein C5167_012210 [Papaver somniferum]|uniref:Peptide N-acetyl-beta-D-glucosaminyl asparaginase amidase A N-terminal domain-containing protein n=1 Tax=Papaver somniferum TaxID=3469 RepID=A0A4Y7J083_PAPSO|nr:peptide-N4-(N-acetyl-beta-glucosaminyl)asparagine amidase A-like [Papaver somniferum]RZC53361.1 hypothetical protein C5167_012210 [Papaver somniferum]
MSSSSSSPILLILIISTFMINISTSSSPNSPDRYLKSLTNPPPSSTIQTESIEVTKPPPPNPINPNCSIPVLQNYFNNTPTSPPFSTPYSPPENCSGPWNKIFLEYSVSSDGGEQDDRISGVWLQGIEILRTSTPQGNPSGSFWKIRKDVSRYSSLFTQSNLTLSVMLESESIDDWFTGFYQVNVSLFYYQDQDLNLTRIPSVEFIEPIKLNRKLGGLSETSGLGMYNAGAFTNETSPDLIIPISDNGGEGFWFRIKNESDIHSKTIQIPQNTRKAVLEIYVSAHGNDEFWYSNLPNEYIESNHLSGQRGNGAFRQVIATVDGVTVGSTTPFPVIFPGGINPLFWDPVVGIGAFNLPTCDIDLTPFLGFLLDGKNHSFGLGVAYSNSVWLVNANLHIWLDHGSDVVTAQSISYRTEPMQLQNQTQFQTLDGQFKIEGQRKTEYSGWVKSSAGNFTTRIYDEFKFKNEIKLSNNGQDKEVEQRVKVKTEIRTENDIGHEISKSILSREYPLKIRISTLPGAEADTFVSTTDVSHSTKEKYTRALSSNEQIQIESENSQESSGWMLVKDGSVLSGSGTTSQTLTYKDLNGFYSRVVSAANGKILQDDSTVASVSLFSA